MFQVTCSFLKRCLDRLVDRVGTQIDDFEGGDCGPTTTAAPEVAGRPERIQTGVTVQDGGPTLRVESVVSASGPKRTLRREGN